MVLTDCISNTTYSQPPIFTDTSGLTIQFDNFGLARVSFVVLHKSESIQGGEVNFTINGRNFEGVIDNIVTSELEGSDYQESRVTFVGFAC